MTTLKELTPGQMADLAQAIEKTARAAMNDGARILESIVALVEEDGAQHRKAYTDRNALRHDTALAIHDAGQVQKYAGNDHLRPACEEALSAAIRHNDAAMVTLHTVTMELCRYSLNIVRQTDDLYSIAQALAK